jgi:hypothetical protein
VIRRTRNLGELASRSPETLKHERCVLVQNKEEHQKGVCVRRFSQGLCKTTKGPVDSFKGFQKDPKEPFHLWEKSNPETGRSVDPAEARGLHHQVRLGRRLVVEK